MKKTISPKHRNTQNITGLFQQRARARACCLAPYSTVFNLRDMDFVDSMAAASAEAR